MSEQALHRSRYLLHGLGVEVSCQVPGLLDPIHRALGEFVAKSLVSVRPAPICGTVRTFEEREVLRHLSPTATRISSDNDLVELYEEGERFWLIDDKWGLCELNVMKGQWKSWILPNPTADANRIIEHAVLWPIAQLLRSRGLCIIPAAGVVRDGWGTLMLSSFNIEPELTALVHAGYRVVGQSWVALREDEGRIVMLQMPGSIERQPVRSASPFSSPHGGERVDLTSEFCGSSCPQAVCDAVLMITPGRRPIARIQPVAPTNAAGALRYAWPLTELHPLRRQGQMPARIAAKCKLFDVQLSRSSKEILTLMDTALADRTGRPDRKHVA